MRAKGEDVLIICGKCYGDDLRITPLLGDSLLGDSLIQCRTCGSGVLKSELPRLPDGWKLKLDKFEEVIRC